MCSKCLHCVSILPVNQAVSAWLSIDMETLNVLMAPLCMLASKLLVLSCMLMVQMNQRTLGLLLSAWLFLGTLYQCLD